MEEAFLHGGVVVADGGGEGAQLLLLVAAELGGHFHLDADVEVAAAFAGERHDAFFAQAENRAALGAGGDFDGGAAVQAGHFQFATQGGDGEWKGHLAEQVGTIALEHVVIADMEENVQIAGFTAAHAGIAVAGRAQAGAGVHAGGNAQLDAAGALDAAIAAAHRARVGDGFAGAAALRTGGLLEEDTGLAGDDATAATRLAGFDAAAAF